jgi:hypothetical protein
MTPEESDWAVHQTGVLILAAIDCESERVASIIREVAERLGDTGVYAVCCAVAEAIAVLGKFQRGDGGWHGFEVQNLATGENVGADAIADDSILDGTRFLMAHLNGDSAASLALFYAEPVRVSSGLAKLVSAYGRAREAEHKGRTNG